MAETVSAKLVAGVLEADPEAIASCLASVEDTRAATLPQQRELIRCLEEATPSDHRVVGLTGPPGAGKSTLAAALIRHWLASGSSVGMVAVDPSSRRSGGALLGDRARLRFGTQDRVFVRSMAARTRLGGLAPATRGAVTVLRAAYPWTLVETVGVGQSEVDVATVADTVILVLQPGSGDTLQFMKAGILEIPDLLVVHKWDLGSVAERTRSDLESMLALTETPAGGWRAPVLPASALEGTGVSELADAIATHAEHLESSSELETRRQAARVSWTLELFCERYGALGLERVGGREAAEASVRKLPGSALDAFSSLASQAALEP